MADSTLEAIRRNVRRITRSPSSSQITTAQIDEYINTFVLYDLPENLRLFTLNKNFVFFTEPNIDSYDSDNTSTELNDFKNKWITFKDPVYIAGKPIPFYQNNRDFFAAYPKTNIVSLLTYGNGVTTHFTGTLSSIPVIRGMVLFSSQNTTGISLHLTDDTPGVLTGSGSGTIDYITGAYDITFSSAPADGVAINSQTVPYLASLPQAILYYDNTFTFRPVPDQAYRVEIEAYIRPTELLAANQIPELEQWAQYITYGAAKKIFESRMDLESVALIMPEFKNQEILVERRSIVQRARKKVKTIFNSGIALNRSPFRRW